MEPTTQESQPRQGEARAEAGGPERFRLAHYFTITMLAAFAIIGAMLVLLQYRETEFFDKVQRDQHAFFVQAQAGLGRQNEQAARATLLAVHEAAHVTLTRVVANMLWASDFGPFVARVTALPIEHCRALPKAGPERKACFADLGERIRALPGFRELDAKAYQAMQATKVFKIKVWDLRGITVYSSEQRQIGEDGMDNQGWRAAAAGLPASELTHRDRFSAFEGVVENRDLISSYVPVYGKRDGKIMGVLELYSDVTPLLEELRAASRRFAEIAASNEAQILHTADANRDKVRESSERFLLIIGGLLALLYVAALLIVRVGQRIIDRQMLAEERAARREHLWHREKMAALSALAANITHEVGNPLAVIAGVAQQLPDAPPANGAGTDGTSRPGATILAQTDRIAAMMRQLSEFAAARSDAPEWIEVNAMVKAVCDFFSFDQRYRGLRIDFRPAAALPACELVPDQLNEVMMNVLEGAAACLTQRGEPLYIVVETALRGAGVAIRVGLRCLDGKASPATRLQLDAGFEPARRRMVAMRGKLSLGDGMIEILLPSLQ